MREHTHLKLSNRVRSLETNLTSDAILYIAQTCLRANNFWIKMCAAKGAANNYSIKNDQVTPEISNRDERLPNIPILFEARVA